MPGARPISEITETKDNRNKEPNCNCELCSKSITLPKPASHPSPWGQTEIVDDIPCIKPVKRLIPGSSRNISQFHIGCIPKRGPERPDPADQIDISDTPVPPCRRKPQNIIRRNKIAIKILSKQLRGEKINPPCCDTRYDKVELFPTAKHARHWAPAYSLARDSKICPRKKKAKKPALQIPSEKQMTIEDILNDPNTTCSCELMANALRPNLHHHLGLSSYRDKINAGYDSPPKNQSTTSLVRPPVRQ